MIADFVVVSFVSFVPFVLFVSLSLSSLHSLNSLNSLIKHLRLCMTQFLVKSREMWCQMKEPRMGHTKMYFPFGALSLVPQIAAFHKKLHVEGTNILPTHKYSVEYSSLSLNLGNRLYSLNNLVCKSYIANGDTLSLTDNERLGKYE